MNYDWVEAKEEDEENNVGLKGDHAVSSLNVPSLCHFSTRYRLSGT